MKKMLAILLAAMLMLTACGPDGPDTSDPVDSSAPDQSVSQSTTQNGGDTADGTTTQQGGDTTQNGGDTTTQNGGQTDNTTTQNGGNGTTAKPTTQQGGNGGTTTTTTKKPTTTTKPTVKLEASEVAFYQNIVDTENKWLASLQLSNGAMPMNDITKGGTSKVTPYFSDFAALALLNQADKYASNVKKYMDWHFSHLNTAKTDYNGVDGTIYDYNITVSGSNITEAVLVSDGKKSYDSTDSYAATFLMVVQKYVEKTGDKAYVIAHAAEIERIVNAMFATMVNGLTLAKPDYAIKYLMDNCEVYAGMLAGEKIYTDVLVPAGKGSTATRDKLKNGAKTVAEKIESKMWTGSYYHPALGYDDGVAYKFSWSNFYPSASSQTFLILFGLLDPSSDRAKMLYNKFCENVKWETFQHGDSFYWGSNVQTAAMMGDLDRVKTFMTTYAEKIMPRHKYPLYNADAAKVSMAAYLMTQMG